MKMFFVTVVSLLALSLVGCNGPTVSYHSSSHPGYGHGHYDQRPVSAGVYSNIEYRTGDRHTQEFYPKLNEKLGVFTETEHYSGKILGVPVEGVRNTTTVRKYVQYGTHLPPWHPDHPWNKGK